MKLKRISSAKFTHENCAESYRVFLIENIPNAPFIRPVAGWKIIGYGNAPWPGCTNGFAVMMEKQTPASESSGIKGEDLPEGTQIWQHFAKEYLDGQESNDSAREVGR